MLPLLFSPVPTGCKSPRSPSSSSQAPNRHRLPIIDFFSFSLSLPLMQVSVRRAVRRDEKESRAAVAPTAQEANDVAISHCREALQAGRQELASREVKMDMGDPALTEAVRRWGPGVLAAGNDTDWTAYLASRIAIPPQALPSPYALLQERFAHDQWRLLIACILMSRVASAPTKERCIAAFFQRCPTPTAALAADPSDILPLISSLGLFPTRMSAIVNVTTRFLSLPVFDVGLQGALKIPGIGEFAYHVRYVAKVCDGCQWYPLPQLPKKSVVCNSQPSPECN